MKRIQIPETLTEVLNWIKECTEKAWSKPPSDANNYEEWLYGAKWQPLSEAEIDSIEAKNSIKFSSEHREFLRILHSVDKYEPYEDEKEHGEVEIFYKPNFYNWLKDKKYIEKYLAWSFITILEDIEGANKFWLKAWGTKPETAEERKQIFSTWYAKAPRLLPLTSHRFLVNDDTLRDRPVLSVYGSDIILWGSWEFKLYLLKQFGEYMGLYDKTFDEEFQTYYLAPCDELQKMIDEEIAQRPQRTLPYWEDVMLYWSSGWRSFGKECPFAPKTDGFLRPIVSENSQATKTFTDHSS